MATKKYAYNTNLAKGTGLINETLILIDFYKNDASKKEFLDRCIAANILDKSTEHRTKDIIRLVFFDRYWNTKRMVVKYLKNLRESGLSLEALKTLLYVYTARANQVFFDFVLELDNHKNEKITHSTARSFLLNAMESQMAPSWSDSIIKRVSSYLMSCIKDFNVCDEDGYLNLRFPDQMVINYLIHEYHFQGMGDNDIIHDDVWKLLGLSQYEIVREIEKISFRGTFIFQYSGEIIRIGWNYQNMEEFIENECR